MFYVHQIPKKPGLNYKWRTKEFYIYFDVSVQNYNEFLHGFKTSLSEVEDLISDLINEGVDYNQIFVMGDSNEYCYHVDIGWWAPMTEAEKKRAQAQRRKAREQKRVEAEKQRKEDEKLYNALIKKYPDLLDRREK